MNSLGVFPRILLILLLFVSNVWGETNISPSVMEEWIKSVNIGGAQHVIAERIPAEANPLYLNEGDSQPVEYRFISESNGAVDNSLNSFAYLERPVPSLRWDGSIQTLESLDIRWQQNSGEWSWNDMAAYRIRVSGRKLICIDSGFSGIGRSGRMQYVRAVVVFAPGRKNELLYLSGYMLGCRALFDFSSDESLGFIEFEGGEDAQSGYNARLVRVDAEHKREVLHSYRLEENTSGGAGKSIVAREIPVTNK